jgi:dihydrofolate reductase
MGKLSVFNFVSLNGFFEGPGHDICWHRHGAEENEYAIEALQSESTLLFGRVTYELMAGFWPTPQAIETDPIVARRMNSADKIVFSRTLEKADWNKTRLVKDDAVEFMKKMKPTHEKEMTILGSGSIVVQFAERGLIDEYQVMVDPVALGAGTTLFQGLRRKLDLKLTKTRVFKSGVVLLCYEPLTGV